MYGHFAASRKSDCNKEVAVRWDSTVVSCNPHWRKITCDKINPWNGNSTVFLYHISPKSVHFSSFFGFSTNKETIQYIVKAVVIIFAWSILRSASISEKWAPLVWQEYLFLVPFNLYVILVKEMKYNIKDFCPSNTSGPRTGPRSKRVQEAIYTTRNNNNNNNNGKNDNNNN